MSSTRKTFCRICEPVCGLEVELSDSEKVAKIRPDKEHPVSKGFACHKGISFAEIHEDPDRLNRPLRRTNTRKDAAKFVPATWNAAFCDIGDRLRAIKSKCGPDSIAVFSGNPVAFNSRAFPLAFGLASALGTRMSFGAGTQDTTNKMAATEAIYGTSRQTIPDFDNTDYVLCLGCNPKISHWTILSLPNPLQPLRNIVARGGCVTFVNPRRIESVTPATGRLLQIKPDTDVYFLAAMLYEIRNNDGFDNDVIERYGKNITGLDKFIEHYSPDRVAGVTGLSAATIRSEAQKLMSASAASVYMATGVNQGRQGTLAYWLLMMISFVTGNLGIRGGNVCPQSLAPFEVPGTFKERVTVDTPYGVLSQASGMLPAALLPELIMARENPIRALIVNSSNPLLSVGGEEKLRQAFERLEFIVCIDLYCNDTGEMADYVLPASDWLEREDINFMSCGMQAVPYVQYTDAVVTAKHDRRNDWWILDQIKRVVTGEESSRDDVDGFSFLEAMLNQRGLSIAKLRSMPSNTAVFSDINPVNFYADVVATEDGRVDCCPAIFSSAIIRCEEIFRDLLREDPKQLKLISLRTNYMHNSSLANMPKVRKGSHALNRLHMAPDDAGRLHLKNGEEARVSNHYGDLVVEVSLDNRLRVGVVAISHGYGHGVKSMKLANSAGVNVNRLMPTGQNTFERLSNMSQLCGVPVTVAAVGKRGASVTE